MQGPVNERRPLQRLARKSGPVLLVLLGVAVALAILLRIPKTATVFVVATLVAFGVHPVVELLSRRMGRGAAIAIVYAMLMMLLVLFFLVIVPEAILQTQLIFVNSPDYLAQMQAALGTLDRSIQSHFGRIPLPPALSDLQGHAVAEISQLISRLVSSLGVWVVNTVNALVIGVTALILSYYLLVNEDAILNGFNSLFPASRRAEARGLAHEISSIFGGFIIGQVILCAATGAMTFAALWILRFKYAVLIAVVSGLFYAIPYIGPLLAMLLGAALGALQGWPMAGWVTLVVFLAARVSDYVLVPKVMSAHVGISPIAIIFAVFAGGELFGLWGLLLAIPVAALIKTLWMFFIAPQLAREGPPAAVPAPGAATPPREDAAEPTPPRP
ncbi:MAG TPA: AI-2E family transporter [Candidatus Dormibacteraeota bacterium]|nr:AI-2E family transporter [Candidatus Dormibacteraeota bacterium]